MYRKVPSGWTKHWDFILVDLICVQLSFLIAYRLRQGSWHAYASEAYRIMSFVLTLITLIEAIIFEKFKNVLKLGYYKKLTQIVRHDVLSLLGVILFFFLLKNGSVYSRAFVLYYFGIYVVLGFLATLLLQRFLLGNSESRKRSILVVSTSDQVVQAIHSLEHDASKRLKIKGLVVIDRDMTGQKMLGIPVVANLEGLTAYVSREWIDEVFISTSQKYEDLRQVYEDLLKMGITVHRDIGLSYSFIDYQKQVEKIGDSLVVTTSLQYMRNYQILLKRVTDILGGIVGSLLALILMALVAIPIKRESPGPLLYTADRIGMNGKRFRMYKIRSMYLDADKQKEALMAQNRIRDERMFKLDFDPRVIGNELLPDGTRKTGIGEFIRRSSIDEFPQFFNVLKGDMSLVGTRPPTPDEWERYDLHHRARMSIKPGLTGMWQVNGRSEITDFEEVVRLDMEYITNWSFALDLKILFKTVFVVLKRKGSM